MRPPTLRAWSGVIADLFSGAGGWSTGVLKALGRSPDVAVNHSRQAIGVHRVNHPETRHFIEDVWQVDPLVASQGRAVDLLLLSPDCRHFSHAKNAPLRDQKIRGLAWSAVRWAASVRPRVILLENVREFLTWGPLVDGVPCKRRQGQTFRAFARKLQKLGYVLDWDLYNASHFGCATNRTRLVLVARCDGRMPAKLVGDPSTAKPASSVIDWSIPLPSIFERSTAYSPPTLARIVEGYRRFAGPYLIHRSNGERVGQAPRVYSLDAPLGTIMAQGIKHALVVPFMVKHYSARGDGSNTCAPVTQPLSTITVKDHNAVAAVYCSDRRDHRSEVAALLGEDAVRAGVVDIGMRYLVPTELFAAQSFPRDYVFDRDWEGNPVTKTDQVKLVGNSMPPLLAEAAVRAQVAA